jgi:hypothetical protein
MTREIGKALGILVRQIEIEGQMYNDLAAFYAPEGCYRDVKRGEDKRWRQARRHACAVAGMSYRKLKREAKKSCPTISRVLYARYGWTI